MLSPREIFEALAHALQRKLPDGAGVQFPRRETDHQGLEHLQEFFLPKDTQLSEINPEEGEIVAEGVEPHLGVRVDILLPDFKEAAERSQETHAGRNEFARQSIQDHVHALAVCQRVDFVDELQASRVHDMLYAQASEIVAFEILARGGVDLGPDRLRKLDRSQTDPTRASMNQDALARLQARSLVQRIVDRQKGDRNPRTIRVAEALGEQSRHVSLGDHIRAETVVGEGDHRIAHDEVLHVITHFQYGPGAFRTAYVPIRISLGKLPQGREHVPEVQPGRLDPDPNFIGSQFGLWLRLDSERLEISGRVQNHSMIDMSIVFDHLLRIGFLVGERLEVLGEIAFNFDQQISFEVGHEDVNAFIDLRLPPVPVRQGGRGQRAIDPHTLARVGQQDPGEMLDQ